MTLAFTGTETGYQGIRAGWTLSCPKGKATICNWQLMRLCNSVLALASRSLFTSDTKMSRITGRFSRPTTTNYHSLKKY